MEECEAEKGLKAVANKGTVMGLSNDAKVFDATVLYCRVKVTGNHVRMRLASGYGSM